MWRNRLAVRATVLVGLLWLAGCASTSLDQATAARSRTIGIAYALPDTLQFTHPAFGFAFGFTDSMGDVSAWHLDDTFLGTAKAALGTKYKVITAHVDPAAFDLLDRSYPLNYEGEYSVEMSQPPPGRAVRGAFGTALPQADLWVVLRSACLMHAPGLMPLRTPPLVCGAGVSWSYAVLSPDTRAAGIWARMVVYDGNSFDQLAIQPLGYQAHTCAVVQGDSGDRVAAVKRLYQEQLPKSVGPEPWSCVPGAVLGKDWELDRWENTTPAQRSALGKALTQELERAIPPTLQALKLAD